jgi:hypothetical protein
MPDDSGQLPQGVRSSPPANTIIIMSALLKPGALPSRRTSSTKSGLLAGYAASWKRNWPDRART